MSEADRTAAEVSSSGQAERDGEQQLAAASGQAQALAEHQLPQPCVVLRCTNPETGRDTTYYLLGTAHVSASSCEDAAVLIRQVKPEVVLVELCVERKPILTMEKLKVRG